MDGAITTKRPTCVKWPDHANELISPMYAKYCTRIPKNQQNRALTSPTWRSEHQYLVPRAIPCHPVLWCDCNEERGHRRPRLAVNYLPFKFLTSTHAVPPYLPRHPAKSEPKRIRTNRKVAFKNTTCLFEKNALSFGDGLLFHA